MGAKIDQVLLDSARTAMETCLEIKQGEQVLIVTDPVCRISAEAFYQAAQEKDAEPLLLLMEPRHVVGAEPPPAVAGIMKSVDAAFLPVSRSLIPILSSRSSSAGSSE